MSAIIKTSSVAFTAQEDLFLARDNRTIVRKGDKRAVFLLARKGNPIPPDAVKHLGITDKTEPEPLNAKAGPVTPATVSPAAVEARETRPEKPTRTR